MWFVLAKCFDLPETEDGHQDSSNLEFRSFGLDMFGFVIETNQVRTITVRERDHTKGLESRRDSDGSESECFECHWMQSAVHNVVLGWKMSLSKVRLSFQFRFVFKNRRCH